MKKNKSSNRKTSNRTKSNLLILDNFSESDVRKWTNIAKDLDELENVWFYHLEAQRKSVRTQLLEALQSVRCKPLVIENWRRIVDYKYTLEPLNCAGSLCNAEGGGRFNAGIELDDQTIARWPALYIAENHETAYREKFQLEQKQNINGLMVNELALAPGTNYTAVSLSGKLNKVFDLGLLSNLTQFVKVLKK